MAKKYSDNDYGAFALELYDISVELNAPDALDEITRRLKEIVEGGIDG